MVKTGENGENFRKRLKMVESGWKRLKTFENIWKKLKTVKMVEKLLIMVENGWKNLKKKKTASDSTTTHRQTLQLTDWIGPVGQFSENQLIFEPFHLVETEV